MPSIWTYRRNPPTTTTTAATTTPKILRARRIEDLPYRPLGAAWQPTLRRADSLRSSHRRGMTIVMKALHITAHGPPSSLKMVVVPRPPLGENQVRVRVEAAAVNPSDVVSIEGRFPHAVLPRILGRDFAGRVVEGPRELVGTEVWGSGGDLGITRNGTHAEEILLPVAGVSRRPSNLTPEQAAGAGVPFTTAWSCLVEGAALTSCETVVVSGAAGAVGRAA